jgi:hypothetical protein
VAASVQRSAVWFSWISLVVETVIQDRLIFAV